MGEGDRGRGESYQRRKRPEFDGGGRGAPEGGARRHEALAASDAATPCPEQAAMAEAEDPLLLAVDAMATMAHEIHVRAVARVDGGDGMRAGMTAAAACEWNGGSGRGLT